MQKSSAFVRWLEDSLALDREALLAEAAQRHSQLILSAEARLGMLLNGDSAGGFLFPNPSSEDAGLSLEDLRAPPEDFRVTFLQTSTMRLGITTDHSTVTIDSIEEGGLVDRFNLENQECYVIRPGDRILEVNDLKGPERHAALALPQELRLLIRPSPDPSPMDDLLMDFGVPEALQAIEGLVSAEGLGLPGSLAEAPEAAATQHVPIFQEPEEPEVSPSGFVDSLKPGKRKLNSGAHDKNAEIEMQMAKEGDRQAQKVLQGRQARKIQTGEVPVFAPKTPHEFVVHPYFELFFAAMVVLNALITFAQVQHSGWILGHELGYPTYEDSIDESYPMVRGWLHTANFCFGILFCVEVLVKGVVMHRHFVSFWNLFDSTLMCVWLLDQFGVFARMASPMVFRLFRLARIFRMLQLIKHLHNMPTLRLIMVSIKASMKILFWASLVLGIIMMVFGTMLNQLLKTNIADTALPLETRMYLFEYFGTLNRSFLTMMELTLGNWVPVTRKLNEQLTEWASCVAVVYRAFVGECIIKVLTAVFISETMKISTGDDEILIAGREAQNKKHVRRMQALLAEADSSGDGGICWDEFQELIQNRRVRVWLQAQDLDVRDARDLFDLLDNGDDRLTATELVQGISRLRGTARSSDLVRFTRRMRPLLEPGTAPASKAELEELLRDGRAGAARADAALRDVRRGLAALELRVSDGISVLAAAVMRQGEALASLPSPRRRRGPAAMAERLQSVAGQRGASGGSGLSERTSRGMPSRHFVPERRTPVGTQLGTPWRFPRNEDILHENNVQM